MRKTSIRIVIAAGLLLLGLLTIAAGGWGVLAVAYSGPHDARPHNGLAAAVAIASLTTLIALFMRRWRAVGAYLVVRAVLGA